MVEQWLESLRERLLSLAARLEATLPVNCEAWSHTLGECTAYDGYTAGVKCQLLNSRPGNSDVLVLELNLRAMRGEPVIEKLELAWNDFKAQKFKSPLRNPQPVTPQLLEQLDAFFPRFESMARRAISQGVKERRNLYRSGRAPESHPESLEVDAVLKDGRTLRFTVLTFSLHFSRPRGPIERVIVVNGPHPSKIMRAIEAWLELAEV